MTCPVCRRRKPRRECPALASDDLFYLLRHKAAGRDRLSQRLRPPGVGAGTPGGSRATAAGTGCRHAPADNPTADRASISALLPVADSDCTARPGWLRSPGRRRRGGCGSARLPRRSRPPARGVIYEHPPQSLLAQRLANELKTVLDGCAPAGCHGLRRRSGHRAAGHRGGRAGGGQGRWPRHRLSRPDASSPAGQPRLASRQRVSGTSVHTDPAVT